ncbi:oligosaccharide flippase family protein [Reichenbachiella agarivorans]|uniref:Oligosaccharide flippase family protein n=1 Tax=Reichenbachiella agarivorans TaxID=2979464 RepID=A0ABY6CMN0_9BACT|nr:oligosaccharide flippase family protein [Reichenbachiella agarivorans]UXP31773.1 oligosaccharide flippase family protein [Reichenbachiella agarivorans]
MGIVIKQGSISGIITYLGAFIGFFNTIILFPAFLSPEEVGLIRVIPNIAFMLMPIVQLGTSNALIKFAPEIKKKEDGLAQLIGLITLATLIGSTLMSLVIYIFKSDFVRLFEEKSPLINDYLPVIVILIFVLALYSLLENYSRVLLKIIAMNLIKEILQRVMTGILVLLYYFDWIDLDSLIYSLIVIYGTSLILLIGYLTSLGQFKISLQFHSIDREVFWRMATFSLYSIIGASGAYIVLNIDEIMVSSQLGLSENGIYSTAFFFAVMIELSKRAILQITTPLIAQSFENGRIDEIQKMHRQLSINQMIIASLFFIGIVSNLDNVYALMPNGDVYSLGRNVVIIIGLSKLIDMTFANNSEIIVMSKYYRFNMVTILCLCGIMVVLNLYLIPLYGMDGAAYATLISITIFNLVKSIFIQWKLNINPFSLNTLKMLGVISVTLIIGLYFPLISSPILDLGIRSAVITVSLIAMILFFRVSPEVTGIFNKHIVKRFMS